MVQGQLNTFMDMTWTPPKAGSSLVIGMDAPAGLADLRGRSCGMSESSRLDKYLRNEFLDGASGSLPELPLENESHVASWRSWHEDAAVRCTLLAEQLPQLLFGVGAGVSRTPAYHQAILGGDMHARPPGDDLPDAEIWFSVEAHWAGSLPVLRSHDRDTFEWLYRVLGFKGELVRIAPSVHALLITGLPNPGRLVAVQEAWERGELAEDPLVDGCTSWNEAVQSLDRGDRTRFRDRILLTHEEQYASLGAEDVGAGLTESEWSRKSKIIRQEHEFSHYATRRMFGNMRFNLHDELIADCMGFTKAFGCFDAELFMKGLGITSGELPGPDARAWTYVQELAEEEVIMVCGLAASAAVNVQEWIQAEDVSNGPGLLHCLARTDLSTLAGSGGLAHLRSTMAPGS